MLHSIFSPDSVKPFAPHLKIPEVIPVLGYRKMELPETTVQTSDSIAQKTYAFQQLCHGTWLLTCQINWGLSARSLSGLSNPGRLGRLDEIHSGHQHGWRGAISHAARGFSNFFQYENRTLQVTACDQSIATSYVSFQSSNAVVMASMASCM